MSWSYKILIVYLVFIAGMMSMVFVASKQTNEMQEENYYAKELKYQDVIDGKNNLNKLNQKLSLINIQNNVLLKLPVEASVNIKNGLIYFLRPSDQSKDVKVKLSVNEKGEQYIPVSNLINGLYTVKISWMSNGKSFFSEENFNVQK